MSTIPISKAENKRRNQRQLDNRVATLVPENTGPVSIGSSRHAINLTLWPWT
jgi:hypothetical protein